MTDRASLGHWVRRFLMEYAASERNLSPNTRESYRDMLVLLLPFVAKHQKHVRRQAGGDRSVGRYGARLPRSSGERATMLDSHEEPAPCLDPCSGTLHWHAQPTARRVVRADQDGADQEGRRQQHHLSGEAGDRRAAGRSRSVGRARARAIMRCCCSFTTPVRAQARQRRSGSATSTGMQDRFASSARAARSGVVRSGRIPSRSFVASLANGPMTRPCS